MEARGVPLVVRIGNPNEVAAKVATEAKAAIVVGDENPVRRSGRSGGTRWPRA